MIIITTNTLYKFILTKSIKVLFCFSMVLIIIYIVNRDCIGLCMPMIPLGMLNLQLAIQIQWQNVYYYWCCCLPWVYLYM